MTLASKDKVFYLLSKSAKCQSDRKKVKQHSINLIIFKKTMRRKIKMILTKQ